MQLLVQGIPTDHADHLRRGGLDANQQPPVGIGPGVNELQRSPCACLEIPMQIPDGLGAPALAG